MCKCLHKGCFLVQIYETMMVYLSVCSCWLFFPYPHKNVEGSTDCQNLNSTITVYVQMVGSLEIALKGENGYVCLLIDIMLDWK